jgi:hypothetical protein
MKSKKSKSADISKDRANLLLIGGVIAMAFVLMAFEWSTFSGILEIETKAEETSFEIPFEMEKPLNLKKPTPPKPQKTKIKPRTDLVIEKKKTETIKEITKADLDSTDLTDIAIIDDREEGDDVIKIDTVTATEGPFESFDPNVQIPYYDLCKNASYDEKLKCISSKIHETLMDGLEGITPEQIESNKSDKMYVAFVISKEGRITDIVIPHESDFQKGIVQRVKATMVDVPIMHPATRLGKTVAINFSIPIRFSTN